MQVGFATTPTVGKGELGPSKSRMVVCQQLDVHLRDLRGLGFRV